MDHRKSKGIPEKTSTSVSLITLKPCAVCITTKILKEMGIPDHFTCLLRNLYAGQGATVRIRYGKTHWSNLGKEYDKAVYCHSVYIKLYVECIM